MVEEIIAADEEINVRYAELERLTYETLARQQPVARDLRFLVSATRILYELERSGDLVVNLAHSFNRIKGFSDSPHLFYSGYDDKGEWFQLFQIGFGGIPGRPLGDGPDGHSLWPGFTNVPNEFIESYFPLRIERYETIPDSGGAGLHRGGNGLSVAYRFLADGEIGIHDERWLTHPWGVLGGETGRRSTKRLVRGVDDTADPLALDVMREIGHAGNFLKSKHTRRNFRKEDYIPTEVIDRDFRHVRFVLLQQGRHVHGVRDLGLPEGLEWGDDRVVAIRDAGRWARIRGQPDPVSRGGRRRGTAGARGDPRGRLCKRGHVVSGIRRSRRQRRPSHRRRQGGTNMTRVVAIDGPAAGGPGAATTISASTTPRIGILNWKRPWKQAFMGKTDVVFSSSPVPVVSLENRGVRHEGKVHYVLGIRNPGNKPLSATAAMDQ